MNRIWIFILTFVCILGMSGCGGENSVSESFDSDADPIQNTDTDSSSVEKAWTEEEVVSMFSRIQEPDWEYIDCVLTPDHASDRVGAVLFWNNRKETSNVAFFDTDGYYQTCGTYARMPAEPDFAYLGDGAVTFQLETEKHTTYQYTLTITIDGSDVNFKAEAEDDLSK